MKDKAPPEKKRVFSGIQPTGNIHISNYFGAIHHWVDLQSEHDTVYCIVDVHAITVPQNPDKLKAKIREVAALLIAAGITPAKSTIFVQSRISAHTVLAWILNCITAFGRMARMTQFKEKSQREKTFVNVGLFDYPVLMAADILLCETDLVPVGEDQKQHLEYTREVALRFNSRFGKTFKLPDPSIPTMGARVMALDNPLKKMSKGEEDRGKAIYLLDSPDRIRSKVMKAKTDPLREIRFDRGRFRRSGPTCFWRRFYFHTFSSKSLSLPPFENSSRSFSVITMKDGTYKGVLHYHAETKHHFRRFARSLGDWNGWTGPVP